MDEKGFTFIVMGATGDLARKKLFPAIYRLFDGGKIGNDFCIVGASRREFKDGEFAKFAAENVKTKNAEKLAEFAEKIRYFQINFDEEEGFAGLGEFISKTETELGLGGSRLFYLATLPKHFKGIAHCLKKNRLVEEDCGCWRRVIFEKPFGRDEKSAKKLNTELGKVFKERQIYRIDHYLGKELVQNISTLRAGNRVFSELWNRENIDHVQINLLEDFGVEKRGNFYDKEGALKDVGQNHLLQLLCLTAMEIPVKMDEKSLRNEKVKVLKSVKKIGADDFVLGQYEGYRNEEGIAKKSGTETFFAMKLMINNKRWKGVPFYLRSGKNLGKKFASIYVQFRKTKHGLFRKNGIEPNYLVIQIQPEDGILMRLNAKAPGEKIRAMPVKMSFCHACTFGPNTSEAYETLLLDAVNGDQSAFMRSDEIEYSWKIIDNATKRKKKPLPYKKGSFGPKKADSLMKGKNAWFNKIESVVQGL